MAGAIALSSLQAMPAIRSAAQEGGLYAADFGTTGADRIVLGS